MTGDERIFYTDGACSGNPGPGGWACVELVPTRNGYNTDITTGGAEYTTNNEMELKAVTVALVKARGVMKHKRVTIYSDNAYVVNAIIKGWLFRWAKNDWRTKEGTPIKNKRLWKTAYNILKEDKRRNIRVMKVKGHSGDVMNELADRKAVEARRKYGG